MSDERMSEGTLVSSGRETIGQQLARRREAAQLTVAAAAARLRCDVKIIAALEADRFDELGAPVFAQGHLRRYAELVGAPVAEILAEWSQRSAQIAEPDLTRIPRAPARTVDRQAWGRRLTGAAGALVIAVAAWWILQGAGVEAPSVSNTAPNAAPAAPVVAPVAAAESPTPAPVAAVAPSAPAAIAEPPPAPIVETAASLAVTIEVREDCWVELYDASGRRLFFGTVLKGNRAVVRGAAPLRVVLGRADAATLLVAGRAVPIPANLIRNSTAYFTVDGSARLRALPPASAGTP